MAEDQQPPSPPNSDDGKATDAASPPSPEKKTYKKPAISRHGNLRLMTQLE
jgi:hypothetical protein